MTEQQRIVVTVGVESDVDGHRVVLRYDGGELIYRSDRFEDHDVAVLWARHVEQIGLRHGGVRRTDG